MRFSECLPLDDENKGAGPCSSTKSTGRAVPFSADDLLGFPARPPVTPCGSPIYGICSSPNESGKLVGIDAPVTHPELRSRVTVKRQKRVVTYTDLVRAGFV